MNLKRGRASGGHLHPKPLVAYHKTEAGQQRYQEIAGYAGAALPSHKSQPRRGSLGMKAPESSHFLANS